MALKTDDSFLRFVTMGAAGAHQAIAFLGSHGHDARELERPATSNKIWQTKPKRLRMADLFCLRCGRRFEVRSKSKLEVKMSDSPRVRGREWDADLRDEDTVLFIRCQWTDDYPVLSEHVEAFEVRSLRETVATSRLGPPKSAGEGAERDRVWPTVVPKRSGVVMAVTADRMLVECDNGRKQPYRLTGRYPYVTAGYQFVAEEEILAGAPTAKAPLGCSAAGWKPEEDLASPTPMMRFAAVKGIGLLGLAAHAKRVGEVAQSDADPRVQLEAVGALLRLGHAGARELLLARFDEPARPDLRMEAVLIAGEVRNGLAREVLKTMLARGASAQDEELRAAVIWSLGAYGCGDIAAVIEHLGDASDMVAAHAAVAVGSETEPAVWDRLFEVLRGQDARASAGAAWVLEHAGADVVGPLVTLAETDARARNWAIAILGRRGPKDVVPLLRGKQSLEAMLQPWWLAAPGENWLADPAAAVAMTFVRRQTLTPAV